MEIVLFLCKRKKAHFFIISCLFLCALQSRENMYFATIFDHSKPRFCSRQRAWLKHNYLFADLLPVFKISSVLIIFWSANADSVPKATESICSSYFALKGQKRGDLTLASISRERKWPDSSIKEYQRKEKAQMHAKEYQCCGGEYQLSVLVEIFISQSRWTLNGLQ